MEITVTFEVKGAADFLCALRDLWNAKDAPLNSPAKEEPAKEEPAKEEPAKEEPAKEEPAKEEPETLSELFVPTTYTVQDIREAIRRTRLRLEGDDYETNPASEGRKRFHAQLTNEFKKMAAFLASCLPSQLPEELRGNFIRACDRLTVKGDMVEPINEF